MRKKYDFVQDTRHYRKLVNDGVLRTYTCSLCGKALKPLTVGLTATGAEHALKFSKFIPMLRYKNDGGRETTVRYYTGWPKAYVLDREYVNSNLFDLFKMGDKFSDSFICSSACPKLSEAKDIARAAAVAALATVIQPSKNVSTQTTVSVRSKEATPPTGAAAWLYLEKIGLSNLGREAMANRLTNNYWYYGERFYFYAYSNKQLLEFVDDILATADDLYPPYVFLKEYV